MNFTDIESVEKFITDNGIERFKIGVLDLNGILRGKYVSKSKFLPGLRNGLGFCDVIIGCDVNDDLIEGLKFTGWQTGYPDAPLEIVYQSGRLLPLEQETMFFLCEFAEQAEQMCPRSLLRKVLEKANKMGYEPYSAFEYEFTVFNETVESVREKSYQNLEPLSPDNFGYSVLRSSMYADLYHEIMDVCEAMGAPLEGFHTEIGPGVLEAAITYSDALSSADNAVIFKNMVKVIAHRHDLIPTFMAKWSVEHQGQSGHIHVSLRDEKGTNIFYDKNGAHTMSETMRQFVAGQMKYMPELLALVGSTVNDYVRLMPGFWAPTEANWSLDNRTSALRVIAGSEKAQRVEYRVGSASSNPYLALSAAILSGLMGIEEKLELGPPVTGNAYDLPSIPEFTLPHSLTEAAAKFRGSKLARSVLGDLFVDDYATTREWEEKQYRKQITDWQLQRYFEVI